MKVSCTKLKNVPIDNSKLLNFNLYTNNAQTYSWIRFGIVLLNIVLGTILSKLCSGRVKFLTNDIEDFLLLMISGEKESMMQSKTSLGISDDDTVLEWTSLRPHLWVPESTTPPSAVCTVPNFDTAQKKKKYHTHRRELF